MRLPSLRLFSAVIFFGIILCTQLLVLAEKNIPLEEHVQIQQELSNFIANYVKTNLPNMTDFKMLSVYTKSPEKGRIEAYFNYSFKTPTQDQAQIAETELSGIATLKKIKESPNSEWSLDKVDVDGESVTFDQPVVITAGKDDAKKPSPAPTTEGESSKQ